MKNLFFVAVAMGIFSGTSFTANAQTSINLEKVAGTGKSKISLKFIDDIEINPGKISGNSSESILIDKNTTAPLTATPKNTTTVDIEKCSPIQFKYAMVMDREVETITNTSLYNFIDEWWATRYRYGGTTKKGIDCSSFTGKVLESVYCITAPRTAAEQYDMTEKLPVDQLAEGDLVFFNTRGGVSHVGIYLGDNYFAHSSVKYGVTISSLKDDYYSRKFIGGGRICK
jgi:cell wall-associated NlpC family hydrolase